MKPECQQCGSCCRGFLLVEAGYVDVLREPQLLKVAHDPFHLLPPIAEWDDAGDKYAVLACGLERPCQLLRDNECSIYLTRPTACADFQPGSNPCTRARQLYKLPQLRHKRAKKKPVPA